MVDCKDKKCPYHGNVSTRGRTFKGKIIKGGKTVSVRWSRLFYIPKYERYEKRFTKVKAHNPSCVGAKVGDLVKIMECRPLSKTKKFVVIKVLK